MSWLDRNNIIPEECVILSDCAFCRQERWCTFKLKLQTLTEYFCSKTCLDKYCEQMKDMVI